MKTASPELIELLQTTNEYMMADLFEIKLQNGSSVYYSGIDFDVTYDGNVYTSTGPNIDRGRTRVMIGVEVDTLNLEIFPGVDHVLLGEPWLHAANSGVLDGAEVIVRRAFLIDVFTVVDVIMLFSGQVAEIQISRVSVKLTVNSHLQLLNIKMPRNLWQPSCLHTLYDADCGVSRSGSASAVLVNSTKTRLLCSLSNASGYFDQGYVQFTSGTMVGINRTIKSYTPGIIDLLGPLPSVPATSDQFSAYRGCDKTKSTCGTKFNNLVNFRGFPFVPVPETVL